MSESKNTQLIRQVSVGIVIGLIVGVIIGLVIGWVLWPVEYKQAYTFQLVDEEKQHYVAAIADSYNLTRQAEVARKRLEAWTPEEKITALAQLFAENSVQGKSGEAERVKDLAVDLQRAERWDPTLISQVANQLVARFTEEGASEKAQAVSLFSSALGTSALVPPVASASPVPPSSPRPQIPLVGSMGTLLRLCGALLLILILILILLTLRRRRLGRRALEKKPAVEWTGTGPPPLLYKTSSYSLGMDNFDESFAIETEDNEWLGECGMGISESLGDGTPKRVAAFEVWLFDKPNTRTVTKVLMSDFAHNNEALRNKLASRGDPLLATPGGAFTLETPDLTVKAQIVEMEYGDGSPAFGYFNSLKVSLTAHRKLQAGDSLA